MIAIDRGVEPEGITRERRYRLAKAWLAWYGTTADNPGEKLLEGGWDNARGFLHDRQDKKCAFCEAPTHKREHPTEHFRPRAFAEPWRVGESPQRAKLQDRYWWLAWTWENLLFACKTCNGKGRKGNRFPLKPNTTLLPPVPRSPVDETAFDASFDLATEAGARLLIDPAADDPSQHFRWVPWIDKRPAKRGDDFRRIIWRPEPTRSAAGFDPRGRETIAAFGLDEDAQEAVGKHATKFYERGAQRVESLVGKGAPQWLIAQEWNAMCAAWLRPSDEFLLATWCVADFLFPNAPIRTQYALALPSLPSPVAHPRRPVFDDGPAAPAFAKVSSFELRMRIRAREDRASLGALLSTESALSPADIEALFSHR